MEIQKVLMNEYGLKALVDFEVSIRFKYIIVTDGNVLPKMLSSYLASGSVVLYNGIFTDWYNWNMKPWIHFVPISLDYSDLEERMEWLRMNDDKARMIAQNAVALMKDYSRKEQMQCYTGLALLEYSRLYRKEQ